MSDSGITHASIKHASTGATRWERNAIMEIKPVIYLLLFFLPSKNYVIGGIIIHFIDILCQTKLLMCGENEGS